MIWFMVRLVLWLMVDRFVVRLVMWLNIDGRFMIIRLMVCLMVTWEMRDVRIFPFVEYFMFIVVMNFRLMGWMMQIGEICVVSFVIVIIELLIDLLLRVCYCTSCLSSGGECQ